MTTAKNLGGGALEVNPLTKITGQRAALDYPIGDGHSIMFMFVRVTPEIAADWLKANRKNRRLKEKTVTAYQLDMRNSAWMLTHQGVAFDEHGNLTDGQHRLMAILKFGKPVTMLITCGWPTGDKRKTMDAVDRGVQRSLKDQLELQHGIKDSGQVVIITNQISAPCLGVGRIFKSTTDATLAVFELYKEEIKWLLQNPVKTHGLKQATVLGCIALGRAAWPEKTADFYRRLVTGENLTSNSPILHLRNYLLGNQREHPAVVRLPVAYHLCAFAEGKTLSSLVSNSNAGLLKLLSLQQDRVNKIRDIYNEPEMQYHREPAAVEKPAESKPAVVNGKPHPTNAAGIEIGKSLSKRFTVTDLHARLDRDSAGTGYWLSHWRNKQWVEPAGPNEFLKTETFGK